MNALIRKEARLLMWPFVVSVLTSSIPAIFYALRMNSWTDTSSHEYMAGLVMSVIVFGFGAAAVLMSLSSLGQEFTMRTFTFAIAQPISRRRVWLVKTVILAIAIIIAAAIALVMVMSVRDAAWNVVLAPFISRFPRMLEYAPRFFDVQLILQTVLLIAIAAYSGGLWTALFFRNFFTSLSMTVLIPIALMGFTQWIATEQSTNVATTVVLIVYSACGFLFARWQLVHAQDVAWTGGVVSFRLHRKSADSLSFSFARTTPVWAMLKKEFQLQQVAFFVAAVLLPLHLLSFLARVYIPENPHNPGLYCIVYIGALWFVLPALIGSASVAEERRLGTLETVLTQPVSRRTALIIKFAVTLGLSLLLGAVVPYYLEKLAARAKVPWGFTNADGLPPFLLIASVLAAVSFFCSTKARSSIDAFCTTLVSLPVFAAVAAFFSSSNNEWTTDYLLVPRYGMLTPYFCALFIAPTIVWLVWKNFQRVQFRWNSLVQSWLIVALSVTITWATASFTWHRGWEWFMPLEPKHGAPILHVGDHAEVISCSGPLVLLPDGSLWTAQHRLLNLLYKNRTNDEHTVAVTLTNVQVLGSNWVSIGALLSRAFAVNRDGTLWQIRELHPSRPVAEGWTTKVVQQPRQFDTASNWASIAASYQFFIGLKRDGSLWGWGDNSHGQLGPGPAVATNRPVAVWPGTQWSAVFPMTYLCVGVKPDGSVWTWGEQVRFGNDEVAPYHPQQMPMSKGNWTSFAGPIRQHSPADAIVGTRSDGSLWIFLPPPFGSADDAPKRRARIPVELFGHTYFVTETPQQIATETKWQGVYGDGSGAVSALTKDGKVYWVDFDPDNRRESRSSDWVAVSPRSQQMRLAADGTLCYFGELDPYPYFIGPSRRPIWSTNVFAGR